MDCTDLQPPAATWRARIGKLPQRAAAVFRRRPKPAPEGVPPAELTGVLRVFLNVAQWGLAGLVLTAAGAAYAESYRGLLLWATRHQLTGLWGSVFPLQIDVFPAAGEVVLFIAMVRGWDWRGRAGAWALAVAGLALSVAGNVGHVPGADLQSRGTAAVPPLAAFAALWLGLGVLKRILRKRKQAAETLPEPAVTIEQADRITDVLGELSGAVELLAAAAVKPAIMPDNTLQFEQLTEEILRVGRQVDVNNAAVGRLTATVDVLGGQDPEPVPASAEHAAEIAYAKTKAAGNPYTANGLRNKFGISRAASERIAPTKPEPPRELQPTRFAALNGSAL